MGSNLAFWCRDLAKSYGKTKVLGGLALEVLAGQSVALVGSNGAGKSTFIKILLGLVKADAGQGELLGHPLGSHKSLPKIGFVPELPGFWPELSADTMLRHMGAFRGLSDEQNRKIRNHVLQFLGLGQRGLRPMSQYSKGMLQRTAFAQALIHDPDILILDEPMSGLDPRAQEKLRGALQTLRSQKKTLFICSHSLEDIRVLCDQVFVLEKGQIQDQGPVQEVLPRIVEHYRSSEPWEEGS